MDERGGLDIFRGCSVAMITLENRDCLIRKLIKCFTLYRMQRFSSVVDISWLEIYSTC
jgi:hypothetical protein